MCAYCSSTPQSHPQNHTQNTVSHSFSFSYHHFTVNSTLSFWIRLQLWTNLAIASSFFRPRNLSCAIHLCCVNRLNGFRTLASPRRVWAVNDPRHNMLARCSDESDPPILVRATSSFAFNNKKKRMTKRKKSWWETYIKIYYTLPKNNKRQWTELNVRSKQTTAAVLNTLFPILLVWVEVCTWFSFRHEIWFEH